MTLLSEKPLEAVLEGNIEIAAAHDVTVRGLRVTGECDCPEVAILLKGAKGTNVLDSEVDGFEFGIEVVEGDRGTTLKGNVVSDSTSDGIALYATTGVVVKGNVVIGSGGNGLYADATSTGNTFRANRASGSVLFDCRDDSNDGGTSVPIPANTWENNQGTTALPPWICAP